MSDFDMETYIKKIGGAIKFMCQGMEKITNMLDVLDIEIKQLKENDNIQNKKIDKIITSCEKSKAGVVVNNNVDIDLSERQVGGKCKYTDEQIYIMHYNVGNRYKKTYSLNDLVNLTGMSKTYILDAIKRYKKRMGLEV